MKGWEDTAELELQAYLGLQFLMGLQSNHHMEDMWSRDPLISSTIFLQTMSLDRFNAITSALHFVNNEDSHSSVDQLWKIRPVIDVLNKQFLLSSFPTRHFLWMRSSGLLRGTIRQNSMCPTRVHAGTWRSISYIQVMDQKLATPLHSASAWYKTVGSSLRAQKC